MNTENFSRAKAFIATATIIGTANFTTTSPITLRFYGLNKLAATSYGGQGNFAVITRRGRESGLLQGDGDFQSPECIEILKQADVVVTNPPFSLFREYVAQLVKFEKKFLIIGNINCITYKEIFPLIMKNETWLDASIHSGDREFQIPDDYPLTAANSRIDETGKKFIRVKGVRWFTNIDYEQRYEDIPLYKTYTPEEYPKYDNYDAIEVSKTAAIPRNYFGVMGVPITFLDKYNPAQFELLGKFDAPKLGGQNLYKRLLIKRK